MAGKAGRSGRPSKYSEALAEAICGRLADGESLRSICRDDGMPAENRVRDWAINDRNGFSAQYATARQIGLDRMVDELLEIADDADGDVGRDRLRVDTRKWYLSKLAPKRYGDKQTHEHSGPAGKPIPIQIVVEPVAALPKTG